MPVHIYVVGMLRGAKNSPLAPGKLFQNVMQFSMQVIFSAVSHIPSNLPKTFYDLRISFFPAFHLCPLSLYLTLV